MAIVDSPAAVAELAADLAAVDQGAGTAAAASEAERNARHAALGEVGALSLDVHPSHAAAIYRGLVWCQRCGAYSFLQASRGLARVCAGAPTPFGRRVLLRLARSPPLPPPHTAWAD